jgi:hypothetical protein
MIALFVAVALSQTPLDPAQWAPPFRSAVIRAAARIAALTPEELDIEFSKDWNMAALSNEYDRTASALFINKSIFMAQKVCPDSYQVGIGPCRIIDGVPSCASGATETDDLDIICHTQVSMRRCTFPKSVRRSLFKAYHVKGACQIDHRIPLELGGSNSALNIWPQQKGCKEKDAVEEELHKAVCDGKLSLDAARELVLNSWQEVYKAHHKHPKN